MKITVKRSKGSLANIDIDTGESGNKEFDELVQKYMDESKELWKEFSENIVFDPPSLAGGFITLKDFIVIFFSHFVFNHTQHAQKDALIQMLTGKLGTKLDTFASRIFFISGFLGVEWAISKAYIFFESRWMNHRQMIFFLGICLGSLVLYFFWAAVQRIRDELKST